MNKSLTTTYSNTSVGIYGYNSAGTVSIGGGGGGGGYAIPITSSSSTSYTYDPLINSKGSSIQIKGDAQVEGDLNLEGDLHIKGRNIIETLTSIQDKLAIYQPHPELEEKWDNLRDLARQYNNLVKEIEEKEKVWSILKK